MKYASLTLLLTVCQTAYAYTNVNGGALSKCSGANMALTGFTRTGECVDQDDDGGSHHICIDLSSTSSETSSSNFCAVTGQPNWCDDEDVCDGDDSDNCPREHWCVCQWAFASYIELAGGCSSIQDIVCEATNMEALLAYQADTTSYEEALACIESRCPTS